VAVRLRSERLHVLAPDELSHPTRALGNPPATLALDGLLENAVARPSVEAFEGRRLIRGRGCDFHASLGSGARAAAN
jgi:hypothetical protein